MQDFDLKRYVRYVRGGFTRFFVNDSPKEIEKEKRDNEIIFKYSPVGFDKKAISSNEIVATSDDFFGIVKIGGDK